MGLRTNGLWIAVVLAALSGCTAKTTCGGDSVDCGGVCVTMAADNLNCGACGNVCGIGTACVDGACAVSCAAGQVACGGACVDPLTSTTWCGASGDCTGSHAGAFCASWLTCQAGACTCADLRPDRLRRRLRRSPDQRDPLRRQRRLRRREGRDGLCGGETCQGGACACPTAGQVVCGGACVDPQTSADLLRRQRNLLRRAGRDDLRSGSRPARAGSCARTASPVVLDLDTPFATDLPPFASSPERPADADRPLGIEHGPAADQHLLAEPGARRGRTPHRLPALPVQGGARLARRRQPRLPINTATDVIGPRAQADHAGRARVRRRRPSTPCSRTTCFSVTLRYCVASGTMTAPLVQGMPYVTVDYAGGLRPMLLPGNVLLHQRERRPRLPAR